jgi:hypothetical protein
MNIVCMSKELLHTSSFSAAMQSSLQPMQAFVELLYSCALLRVHWIKQCSLVLKAVRIRQEAQIRQRQLHSVSHRGEQ